MAESIRTTTAQPSDPSDPLIRGRFTDGYSNFTIRASSVDAPDSFQVFASDNCADIVLIVSGITSGHLHATWGDGWRTYAPEWKAWVEDTAFKVFYGVDQTTADPTGEPTSGPKASSQPGSAYRDPRSPERPGTVRFCGG